MPPIRTTTVTIGAGASLSSASPDLESLGKLVALVPDAAWDTNAITFQVSPDGTNYYDLYDEGSEYQLAGVIASDYQRINLNMFLGAKNVKVRSGTSGAAVNQVDATVITLVLWQVE